MSNRNVDLSQQSFFSLLRLSCFQQRLQDSLLGFVFFGLSIFFLVLYFWIDDGSSRKEYAPILTIAFLFAATIWFIMACFRAPLAWVRGEPEDSEILLVCIKRCFCCSKRSPSTIGEQLPSISDSDNFNQNSKNIQRSVRSLLLSMHLQQQRRRRLQQQQDETNTEENDSGRWGCIKCISCLNSSDLEEASVSTTENMTQSSTDPADESLPTEDMEMIVLNPDQKGPSQQTPADVTNSADSCQYSDVQEHTEELTPFNTDPADLSTNLSKDIEIDNENRVQKDVLALSADDADSEIPKSVQ